MKHKGMLKLWTPPKKYQASRLQALRKCKIPVALTATLKTALAERVINMNHPSQPPSPYAEILLSLAC